MVVDHAPCRLVDLELWNPRESTFVTDSLGKNRVIGQPDLPFFSSREIID